MKKIITLVFALGTLTSVFAQSGYSSDRKEARDLALGKPNDRGYSVYNQHNDSYSFNSKEKDRQIKQVTMDFNRRIEAVQRNRSMRPYEKQRQIRQLEAQRDQRTREINDRYPDRHTAYNSRGNERKW